MKSVIRPPLKKTKKKGEQQKFIFDHKQKAARTAFKLFEAEKGKRWANDGEVSPFILIFQSLKIVSQQQQPATRVFRLQVGFRYSVFGLMATQKRPKNEAKTYSDQWKQIVAPKQFQQKQ